jgi:ATP-dependent helicase/DNAse subunit B
MIAPEDILENRQFESTEKRFQELVGVYSDYQAYLHEKRLYDDSGVFWRALEILQNSKSDFFSRYKTILIYGFTSFTYLQKRILRELIERIPEAVVFLDYEDDSDRKELFGDPCEILKFLQEFGPDIQRMSPNDNEWKYRHLERNLFRSRSEGDEVCSDFHLFHSPDSAMEIKAITTRIKDLIINEGCAPDDIALVIPKPELYANKIKSIFKEACIPYSLQSRQKIFDTPLGNYLSTFIGAAFADLSRAEFKMIVSSNYFLRFHENSLDNTENIKSDKEAVSVYLSNSAISMIEASDIRSGIDAWEQ